MKKKKGNIQRITLLFVVGGRLTAELLGARSTQSWLKFTTPSICHFVGGLSKKNINTLLNLYLDFLAHILHF